MKDRCSEIFCDFPVEMSELVTARKNESEEFHQMCDAVMAAGGLLPDNTIIETFERYFQTIPVDRSLVISGIPRTVRQADYLLRLLQHKGYDSHFFIFHRVTVRACTTRIMGDKKRTFRKDGGSAVIADRMTYYDEHIPGLEDFLNEMAISNTSYVDASLSPEEVWAQVRANIS